VLGKRFHNGSAPGPSGWTADLLAVLVRDADCATALSYLITDIINGNIPARARARLLACRLIAVPNGTSFRPIGVNDAFYKLAASIAVSSVVQRHSATLFPRVQLGIGVKGGVETAVHSTQAALLSSPDHFTLKLDFRNAFNTRRRSVMASALYSHPCTRPLWALFRFAYGAPSPLLYYGADRKLIECVPSAEGVRQGDPLGSFVFALSVQPLYEAVAAVRGVALAVAVHDDLTITGTIEGITRALALVTAHCESTGAQLSPSKCKLLSAAAVPSQAATDFCSEHNFTLAEGCMPLLGAVIHSLPVPRAADNLDRKYVLPTSGAADLLLQSVVQDHERFFSSLSHPSLSPQCALILLRNSGLPRFNYLARTCPPSLLSKATQYFDQLISSTFLSILHSPAVSHPVTPLTAATQSQLPLRLGGAGLRPYSAITHAAYLSSVSLSLHRIPAPLRLHFQPAIDAAAHNLSSLQCATILPPLAADGRGRLPAIPYSFSAFSDRFSAPSSCPKHYQRSLSHQIDVSKSVALHNASSAPDQARLTSLFNPHSSLWLLALPSDQHTRLSVSAFRSALQLRLGMHPPSVHHFTCACGRILSPPTRPDHLLYCERAGGRISRHNTVLHALSTVCRRAGIAAELEYRSYANRDDRLRPDARLSAPSLDLITDVQVTTPSAPSLADAAASQRLSAASIRETAKSTKYREYAETEGVQFIPFVLEAFGAFGKQSQRILQRISEHYAESDRWASSDADFSFDFWAAAVISVALQRGNAEALSHSIRSARRAAPAPPRH